MSEPSALKKRIIDHYDVASPYYQKLWGQHIHHGYYVTGKESKEEAAENLIEQLIQKSGLHRGSKVLDVGCGIGGTAIYLAEHLDCDVTGITISPVQVDMARKAVEGLTNKPSFLLADANDLNLNGSFDIIWAVEVLNHIPNRSRFFENACRLLKEGGKICMAAWLRNSHLTSKGARYIACIERGMLATLPTREDYLHLFQRNRLRLVFYEDVSDRVKKTWDMTSKLIRNRTIWTMAITQGKDFVDFLKSFRAMRKGYRSGAFRYAFIVAEKESAPCG